MNLPKSILIFVVYIFYLITIGIGQEFNYLEDNTEEAGIKKSDKVIKCNTNECEGSECKCCPGYGIEVSGILFKSYSCQKCDCGKDINCSFGWLGKTCISPTGYSYYDGYYDEFILVQWLKAFANFVVLTLMIVFTVVQWLFFLLYYVIYAVFVIGFTAVTWIFYLTYFPVIWIYMIAQFVMKLLYSLLYNGCLILGMSVLILPLIFKIDYKDYFLLWYFIGKLSLNKLQERKIVNFIPIIENSGDICNSIFALLKTMFNIEKMTQSDNKDVDALADFMFSCPICLHLQLEIVLDKGSFFAMKCGHIVCSNCIARMEGGSTVTCAICRKETARESLLKIFLS